MLFVTTYMWALITMFHVTYAKLVQWGLDFYVVSYEHLRIYNKEKQ